MDQLVRHSVSSFSEAAIGYSKASLPGLPILSNPGRDMSSSHAQEYSEGGFECSGKRS